MPPVRKIPKRCPTCSNPNLELFLLNLRCFRCGWVRNLQDINDLIKSNYKRKV